MLARLLQCCLAIEFVLYAAILVGAFRADAPISGALIRIACIALLWRVSHAGITFAVAAAHRIADRRASPFRGAFVALWGEFRARFTSFNWSQPFPNLALGREPVGGNAGMPILLVHGILSNRGMWIWFRRRLIAEELGPVYTISLEPLLGSIDAMAAKLHARVQFIGEQTGHEKVLIIAHSMGGLVTRSMMANHGAARVAQLITLGSPHYGTALAKFSIGLCTQQMRQGSAWLAALERQETERPHGVPTVSIYTLNDDLVYPPESSELHWARNIAVPGVGHVSLLFSESIVQRVLSIIREKSKP